MWEYRATVVRWVDGDTLDAVVDLGFYTYTTQRLRLLSSTGGVDTAELHSPDAQKRMLAVKAHIRVQELAPAGAVFTARTSKGDPKDSFGRFLAQVVLTDGRGVGDVLMAEGLATVWKP
jgi:micrococcal nuclease